MSAPPAPVPGSSPVAPRLGVVGTGYVGLVTAAALAELGHDVVCLDIDEAKVELLRGGGVPFSEPGLPEVLARNHDRFTFTTDPHELFSNEAGVSSIVFVTVDTPPSASGDADLSRVEAVIEAIPDDVAPLTLVMKSTVPVNTGSRVQRRLRARGLRQVSYAANPEFLREGSALSDVFHPDRVVVGADDPEVAAAVASLWEPLGGELLIADLASAEMIKLASNAFLATKISFVNEIANVCDVVGADVTVVAHGMGLDRRIGPAFLNAGLGYGGSCFPKDVTALKQLAGNSGYHFQLLSSVIEVNELQKRRVITTLAARLGHLVGARVALLGLAFKPDTDDMREASSVVLAERLVAEGVLVVTHDPVVGDVSGRLPAEVVRADTLEAALDGVDAAIIVTEWPEYRRLIDPAIVALMGRPLVIDGRNLLDPATASDAGIEWVGVGRPMVAGTDSAVGAAP
jgi:UDPglucose 6-dehydrogenase